MKKSNSILKVCLFYFATSLHIAQSHAQTRDPLQIQRTIMGNQSVELNDFNVSVPPVIINNVMFLNSFKSGYIKETTNELSSFRWTPGLRWQINENESFIVNTPISFASTGNNAVLSDEARTSMLLGIYARKAESWSGAYSMGIIALDLQSRTKAFPIVGLTYFDQDSKVRYFLGYPSVGLGYTFTEQLDLIFNFNRELNRYFIDSQSNLKSQGRYLEQSMNSINFGLKYKATKYLNIGLLVSSYFSSSWNLMDDTYQKLSEYKTFSGEQSVSVSIGLNGPQPKN